MATAIRLKRGGRTHSPYYKVVVTDSRAKQTGRVIDELGIYQPCARPEPKVEVNADRALEWLKNGARPTDTVKNLLTNAGVMQRYNESKSAKAE